MPSASFLFSAFFVSENLHRKYSRNCTGQKPTSIFSRHVHGDRRRDEGEPRGQVAWVPPQTCGEVVWGPQDSPGVRPSPIYTSSMENPKYLIIFSRKVPSLLSSSTLDREGSGALPAPCRRGDHHQRLYITILASRVMRE